MKRIDRALTRVRPRAVVFDLSPSYQRCFGRFNTFLSTSPQICRNLRARSAAGQCPSDAGTSGAPAANMISTPENCDFAHAGLTPHRVFWRNTTLICLLYACLCPFFACLTDRTDRQQGRRRGNRSRRRRQVCPEPACPSCGANRRGPEVNAAGSLHAEACAEPDRTAPSAARPDLPVGRLVPALPGAGSAAPIRHRPPRPDSLSSPFGSVGRRLLKPGFPIFSSEKTANCHTCLDRRFGA